VSLRLYVLKNAGCVAGSEVLIQGLREQGQADAARGRVLAVGLSRDGRRGSCAEDRGRSVISRLSGS